MSGRRTIRRASSMGRSRVMRDDDNNNNDDNHNNQPRGVAARPGAHLEPGLPVGGVGSSLRALGRKGPELAAGETAAR